MAFGLPGYASGLYRGICWLLHTIQICQPSVWLGCFSKQLGTCISQLSAAECQLFPLASMQPLHRLSRCPECSRCFYKPPWVQCTVVALSVGGGCLWSFIFLHHLWRPRGFLVSVSIFDIRTFVFERGSVMYTQDSSIKPTKIGFYFIFAASLKLKFFYCSWVFL